MKDEFPAVNLANLYRNIRILIEEKKIVSRDFGDGIEHYDAIIHNHYHFVCEICGAVSDIEKPVEEQIVAETQQFTRHRISRHTIQFFGTCAACQENQL